MKGPADELVALINRCCGFFFFLVFLFCELVFARTAAHRLGNERGRHDIPILPSDQLARQKDFRTESKFVGGSAGRANRNNNF